MTLNTVNSRGRRKEVYLILTGAVAVILSMIIGAALFFIYSNITFESDSNHIIRITIRRNLIDETAGRKQSKHHRPKSYHCQPHEIKFQHENFGNAEPDICCESFWHLLHMAYPHATTFIDVGANRGYTAAKIFNLWSPGHGLTQKTLLQKIKLQKEAKALLNNEQLDTMCGDGNNEDYPLYCVGKPNGICYTRRPIHVYSFDGQATHVNDTKNTIYKYFPYLHPSAKVDEMKSEVKATFEYTFTAVTDSIEGANDQEQRYGYFSKNVGETGKLIKVSGAEIPSDANVVPVTTIDQFCKERGLHKVDVLKIDAEDGDVSVIQGAWKTLATRGVKFLNFECHKPFLEEVKSIVKRLDEELGFDCYIAGKYNLMVRYTNCLDEKLLLKQECTDQSAPPCPEFIKFRGANSFDGNMYCTPRNSILNRLFDDRSLYRYANTKLHGHIFKDAMLGLESDTVIDNQQHVKVSSPGGVFRRYGVDPDTFEVAWRNKPLDVKYKPYYS